jgi:S-formylglutathione hydrolase FrmB
MLAALLLLAQLSPVVDSVQGTVTTDTLWSQSLGITKQYQVYLPPSYQREPQRRYPVAFYLHGVSGAETDWVTLGSIHRVLDSLIAAGGPEMVLIMPDGDDAWYTTWNTLGNWSECRRDSTRKEPAATYCVPWPHYDDYIARDLVAHVDSNYRTLADSAHRGIAGLSMGGYGAVTLALRYPDVFSVAASHSGAVAPLFAGPEPFAPPPRYYENLDEVRTSNPRMWRYLRGIFGADTIGWHARDPVKMARRRAQSELALPPIYLDVGVDDPFVNGNRAFGYELTTLGADVMYKEWPGTHDWTYWRGHVGESLTWLGAHLTPSPP